MKIRNIITASAMFIAACLCNATFAAEINLRLGVVTPTQHPHTISAHKFAELVNEKTNGMVKISVSDNGALGSNPELLDAVQTGIIDFTISTPGVMAEYSPVSGILELPYVFTSKNHMMAVTRGAIGADIAKRYLSDTGITILSYMGGAQRNMITSKATIASINDIAGLKMRTWEWNVMLDWWAGLGALGTVISFPEVYTALQTGVVDGAENEFSTFTTARWAEVAKNISLTQHSITVRPLVGNAKKLAALDPTYLAAIHQAARQAADFDIELEGKLDKENMEKLASDYGVVYTEPDKAPMIEASTAVIQAFAVEKGLEDLANAIASMAK